MADYTLSAKITGDGSGFERMMSSAKSSLDSLQSKVTSSGQKMQDIGKNLTSVGDSLSSKITKPALAATSALAGIALVKGFDRLTGIDDARAKLMGLGHDAGAVDEIMKSATVSVKGTAFGMAEAATTAAGAVAAGVKQGDELTRYLSLTADAAAIAGTSMSEMGSIVNKVTTSGRAMTENLEQLSDRGLPIYQWLGEAAGVAASDIKDMASEGKISSEMFMEAIEKNIGGAAQIMGQNSFKSTIANIGASIGRIGANFLDAGGKGGGFFSTLKPMLADFNNRLGVVEDKAAILGEKFGESFQKIISAVQKVQQGFESLSPSTQELITKALLVGSGIAVGIGPALKIVGKLTTAFGVLTTGVGFLMTPIGLVVGAFGLLAAGFTIAMIKSEGFRNKVSEIIGTFWKVVQGAGILSMALLTMITSGPGEKIGELREKFLTMFPESIWNSMMNFSQKLSDIQSVVGAFIGIITGSISSMGDLDAALGGVLDADSSDKLLEFGTNVKNIFDNVKNVITDFASTVGPLIGTAVSTIGQVLSSLSGVLQPVIANFSPQVATFIALFAGIAIKLNGPITSIAKIIISAFSSIGPGMTSVVTTVAGGVGKVVGVIGQLATGAMPLTGLLKGIGAAIGGLFSPVTLIVAGITALIAIFATLMATSSSFRETVVGSIQSIISAMQPALESIKTAITQIISAVLPVITSLIQQMLPVFQQIFEVILQLAVAMAPFISALITQLAPAIANIISAVMNIITAVAPAVIAIIQAIITVIQTLIPIISSIIGVVISVVTTVISTISTIISVVGNIIATIMGIISPIISFIAGVIGSMMSVISPIIAFISGVFTTVFTTITGIWNNVMNFTSAVFNGIGGVISGISSVVSSVFNGIFGTISGIMNDVSNVISGVFQSIQNAWNGLTAFVSGVFEGVGSAVNDLVSVVKGFVNDVISGINGAIGLINKIPGVSLGEIPYLNSGTNNWQGGFARMNEGGRGELAMLPSGTQVIPHDVSMKYAKESAKRAATNTEYSGGGTVVHDYRGMNEGATFVVREEADIDRIAVALEKRQVNGQRSKGYRIGGAY
ncbi:tape measure protein [Enterococcus sp. AZ103]|uniref:tape measure protein n=1 Tax=Enterococcus sp. AZ103 TaxID=2774628 RepID=UPI003F285A88